MANGTDVYTGTVWPNNGDGTHYQALAAFFFLTAFGTLVFFLSRRVPSSWAGWKHLSLARLFVVFTMADSALFIYFSGILVLGIGTSLSEGACAAGIWWCIMLYATSKIFIYCFLLERLHVVWARDKDGKEYSRAKSPMYRVAVLFLLAWIGVAICMIVGRVSFIRAHDNVCTIGLKLFATIPMLTVDVIVNVYLTLSFVIPIYRSRFTAARSLAIKSSLAAIAALITSFSNIAILTVLHGKQLSWVCLMSCGFDVFLNAAIIFLVTTPTQGSTGSETHRPPSFTSAFGGSAGVPTMRNGSIAYSQHRPSIVSLGGLGGRRSSSFSGPFATLPQKKFAHPSEGIVLPMVPQSPPQASWDSQNSSVAADLPGWGRKETDGMLESR